MDIQAAIRQFVARQDLSDAEASHVMREIMTGQCTDAQIGAFLVAQQMKGVATSELLGAARVMRELATPASAAIVLRHPRPQCARSHYDSNSGNVLVLQHHVAAA